MNRVPTEGLPPKIWIVVRPGGEPHFITKPPDEGMAEWAKGLYVTIAEYTFVAITHTHAPVEKA